MPGRRHHGKVEQEQPSESERHVTYSLRKPKQIQEEIKNNINDAFYYISKKKDRKGLIVKEVNETIGKGVFATKEFEAGSFLLEYDGELIKAAEGRHREKTYPLNLGSYIFFFQCGSNRFCLDGTFSKRKGRYINDGIGSEQNSTMKMVQLHNRPYLAVFASRKILKGEEIRYDYGVPDLPWRTKTTNKKKFQDTSIQDVDGSCEVEVETVMSIKDCRVEIQRLSHKKIEDSIAGKTEKRNENWAEANDEEILKLNKPLARIQERIVMKSVGGEPENSVLMDDVQEKTKNIDRRDQIESVQKPDSPEEIADIIEDKQPDYQIHTKGVHENIEELNSTEEVIEDMQSETKQNSDKCVENLNMLNKDVDTHSEIIQRDELMGENDNSIHKNEDDYAKTIHNSDSESDVEFMTKQATDRCSSRLDVLTMNKAKEIIVDKSLSLEAAQFFPKGQCETMSRAVESKRIPPEHVCIAVRSHLTRLRTPKDTKPIIFWNGYGSFDWHGIQALIALHAKMTLQKEVVEEMIWMAEYPNGFRNLDFPDMSSIEMYRQYVWNQSKSAVLNGLSVEYLTQLLCDRTLSETVIEAVLNLLNKQSVDDTYILFHPCFIDDKQAKRTIDQLLKSSSKYLHLILNVQKQTKDVLVSNADEIGSHWSYCTLTTDLEKGVYIDSLGWQVPSNLMLFISPLLKAVAEKRNIKFQLPEHFNTLHSASTELIHVCNKTCNPMAPLQTCGNICGVAAIALCALSLNRPKWEALIMSKTTSNDLTTYEVLKNPSEHGKYLRFCLMSWIAAGNVDVNNICKCDNDAERVEQFPYATDDGVPESNVSIETQHVPVDCIEQQDKSQENQNKVKIEQAHNKSDQKAKKAVTQSNKTGLLKPKRPCPFCGKFVGDLTKHMRSKIHKDEEEIKAALEMKKEDRDHAFKMLRRKGYFNVNVQRIRDDGDAADIITERKRGQSKEHAFCSLCNGVFVKAYISRHKKICKVAESSTDKPVSVPLSLVASEEKLNQNFKESVLAKFLNNDIGNTCRTDPFIIQYGQSRYKRAFSRVDKKLEVRTNTMSDMRRLAALYLCFKEEALKDNVELKSAVDIFNRPYFGYLEDALDAHTIDSDGKLKSGLRRGLGYLISRAAYYWKGQLLQQRRDDESKEMGRFMTLFKHKYSSLFDAAEYNCVKARHEKHRRPAELPEEREVTQIKNHLLAVINRLSSDKYKLLSSAEYNELRDYVCCRLTLFNARRGNEPSSLRLKHWDEANNKVWLTKDCENVTKNPSEKRLLQRFKLAYQSGKSVGKDVPNLIPEDCWLALEKLADPGIRAAAGVQKNNEFLFPCIGTEKTNTHVSGSNCCKRVSKSAGLSRTITATSMRHRASTIHADRNVSESDKKIFYQHMGHSAEINENVYQCPIGVKEITVVGGFLTSIDGQSFNATTEDTAVTEGGKEMDGDSVEASEKQPSEQLFNGQSDNSSLSEYDIQAFLGPLVTQSAVIRAVTGRGLINEDEIESIPEILIDSKDVLCDPVIQAQMREYFTDDAWSRVVSTIKIIDDVESKKSRKGKRKRKRKADEDSDDESFEFNESDYSSDEDVVNIKASKRKRTFEKNQMTKTKEREYYQWKENESKIVSEYFKDIINNTSSLDTKGPIPGSKVIKQFLELHPILNDLVIGQRIQKVKSKIWNERNKMREKVKKGLSKFMA